MLKIKVLFIVLLFSARARAQTTISEQEAVHETAENLFAALTNADSVAM